MVVKGLQVEEQWLLTDTTAVVIFLDIEPVLAIGLLILTDSHPIMALQVFLHVVNFDLSRAHQAEHSVVVSRITAELQRFIISHAEACFVSTEILQISASIYSVKRISLHAGTGARSYQDVFL